jgi:SAM-dependent methyltransferase
LEAELHDLFWSHQGEPAELPLLADFLTSHPGHGIEVGCGSGRLLLPLLAAGHTLDGLDSSPDMLRLCREAAHRQDLAPVLHLGDMAGFAPPRRYASVAVPTFTLQLAPDPAFALDRFAGWLQNGGGLFLTTFVPEAELAGELPENDWFEDHRITLADGSTATVETRHTLDRGQKLLDRHHRYHVCDPAGEQTGRHESRQMLHWFGPGELESLVETAGFEITRRIAEFDPAADPDDAQILTICATRRPC